MKERWELAIMGGGRVLKSMIVDKVEVGERTASPACIKDIQIRHCGCQRQGNGMRWSTKICRVIPENV